MAGEVVSQGGAVTDLVTVQQQGVKNLGEILRALQNGPPQWQAVPATSTSAGVAGQLAYNASFIYICVGPNSWRRIALGTF